MRFKTFLINEVKYEGGIDVEVDQHGRVKEVGQISGSGKKDSRSEATANIEMGKHASGGRTNQSPQSPSPTQLSDAEHRRAEERKKRKAIPVGSKLHSVVKKFIAKVF